jgi:hypothetical protein
MIPQKDIVEIQHLIKEFSTKYKSQNENCIDKLFLYLASEGIFTANYFIEINKQLYDNEVRYRDLDFYHYFVKTLIKILLNLQCRSTTENFQMPTEIKIIYECVSDTFETQISYDKHFCVRKPTIGPYEVFNKWFEDTKKEYEEKYGKQDES